jgi:NAD(P)-dependent dehydrogenase (short-subunit alcohol dehydrogenase family)
VHLAPADQAQPATARRDAREPERSGARGGGDRGGSVEGCGSGQARGTGRGFAIDLLVNDAGATAFGPVLENGPAAERTTVEVNAVAVVDLTARLLPGMIERARRRRAGLINISSMLAFQPTPFLTTYAARNALVLIYSQYQHEAGVGRFGHGRLDRCGLQASQRKPDSQGRAARRGEPARSPIPHGLGAAPSARASRAPSIQLRLG